MDGGPSIHADGGRPNEVLSTHKRGLYKLGRWKAPKEPNHNSVVQVPILKMPYVDTCVRGK